ncbi:MAG: heavy-metal-associated domain-containing protein [Flavobacteriales bacterium]|nr:heavy-metal-associated domain-containing protein [Flavobacteriales bacterium]
MFGSLNIQAQDSNIVKESFKVWGNCEMCKTTIEKAVKPIDGIISGKWKMTAGKMVVKYDKSKTSLVEIKKAIAAVGYDTEEYRASDDTYSKLHHCCQYERPK